MTRLPAWGVDPFDLLWKNLFDQNSSFSTLGEKISYPVDIIETSNGVVFELAVVGLDYEDIDIEVSNDVLRIKYSKENEGSQPTVNYIHKGIARRSFDLAWKISSKLNLSALDATLDKGLLRIEIPMLEVQENAPKKIQIKPKALLQVDAK
jgi:HSP20 family molecular chaperone IbpA